VSRLVARDRLLLSDVALLTLNRGLRAVDRRCRTHVPVGDLQRRTRRHCSEHVLQ